MASTNDGQSSFVIYSRQTFNYTYGDRTDLLTANSLPNRKSTWLLGTSLLWKNDNPLTCRASQGAAGPW
jgi:hypothetical protein